MQLAKPTILCSIMDVVGEREEYLRGKKNTHLESKSQCGYGSIFKDVWTSLYSHIDKCNEIAKILRPLGP